MNNIRIQLPIGKVEVSVLAPILGQYGFNLMDFCKKFNEKFKGIYKDGVFIKILIKLKEDRTIEIVEEGVVIHFLIKEEGIIGEINIQQLYNIYIYYCYEKNIEYQQKEGIIKSLIGTIRSMGIKIIV